MFMKGTETATTHQKSLSFGSWTSITCLSTIDFICDHKVYTACIRDPLCNEQTVTYQAVYSDATTEQCEYGLADRDEGNTIQ